MVLSDVHLGHSRTSSWRMLKALKELLPDDETTREIDMLVITGDLFDQLLTLDNFAAYVSYLFSEYIFYIARKYDIIVRDLLGTKSHDRNQNIQLELMWANQFPDVNFRYVNKLSIEHFADFGIDVLYLPDEWNPQADKTLAEAKELLNSYGLTKVHIAFTHGAYYHQLNGFRSPSYHDPVEWSNLVHFHVLSGHIHNRSMYLKIISVGPLERLGHDQEEPKGAIRLSYRGIDDYTYRFLENRNAREYRTYNLNGLDVKDVMQAIGDDALPSDAAVRLEYTEEPVYAFIEVLESVYPTMTFTSIKRGKKKDKVLTNSFMGTTFKPTPINQHNIESLMVKKGEEEGLPDAVIDRMKRILGDLDEREKETQ